MKTDDPVNRTNGRVSGSPTICAERLARLARLAAEPAIEQLRAGDGDAIGRHAVIGRPPRVF